MRKPCVQTLILRKILGILRSDSKNLKISSSTLFSELSLSDSISEIIKLDLNIELDIPEIPNDIIYRIPVSTDSQDEHTSFNKIADFGLSIRDMSISITLWLLQKHPNIHAKLSSL